MNFEEASKKIITIGVESMINEGDSTTIHFILKNGEVITITSEEMEVDYVNPSGYADGTVFVQSSLKFMKGDVS